MVKYGLLRHVGSLFWSYSGPSFFCFSGLGNHVIDHSTNLLDVSISLSPPFPVWAKTLPKQLILSNTMVTTLHMKRYPLIYSERTNKIHCHDLFAPFTCIINY